MEHQIQEGEKEQRATELIDGIISSGLVIECPKESEMLLGKTRDVLAVPTFELIKKLDDFIVTAHDKKFLDHSFLIKLQKYIGFKNHELPYINFNLPEELILQIFKDFSTSQISLDYRGGRGPLNQLQKNLFKLNQLFNATYSVAESDPNNNEKMISLTKSARKMDAVLLCTEVEEELLKMAQLLELV